MPTAKKTEISAAELELKRRGRRRLVGAVTLGLLAIVILPMVFDAAPKKDSKLEGMPKQEISIQIPPKEGLSPLPAPTLPPPTTSPGEANTASPIVKPVLPEGVPPVANLPVAKAEPAKAVVAKVETPTTPTVESKSAPKAEPAKAASTKSEPIKSGGFVVQIGAYKEAENAATLVTQMKAVKLPVFTDTIAVKAGKVTRVRLGPFATKEKAEDALIQAKLAGVVGKVVPQ